MSFLKDTRGLLTWTTRDLAETLAIPTSEAAKVITIMEMQGYVKAAEGAREWFTTPAGQTMSGSKLPHYTPERVTAALAALKERIAAAPGEHGKGTIRIAFQVDIELGGILVVLYAFPKGEFDRQDIGVGCLWLSRCFLLLQQRLAASLRINEPNALAVYRQRYSDGIVRRSLVEEEADARALYLVLAQIGGAQLVGPTQALPPGTFYRPAGE